MMYIQLIWKRIIGNQLPLSSNHLSIAASLHPRPRPFTAKPHIKFTNFCTQTAVPYTTPGDRVFIAEFMTSKCGLTDKEIAKVLKYHNYWLRAKSTQISEEVLELLNDCGLTTPAQIRKAVLSNPGLLFGSSKNKIKSKLSFLRTFMKEDDIFKVFIRCAKIFTCSEDKIKSTISVMQRLGVEGQPLSELVALHPRLLATPEEKITESFKLAEHLGLKKGSKMFAIALRALSCIHKETADRRLRCLSSFGFAEKQILQLSPWILGASEEKLKRNMDFLINSVGLPLDDLVKRPMLFTYSLEKRIIPRYRVLEASNSMPVLKPKTNFVRILQLPERRFLDQYVNSNPEYSLVLQDIYHGGKAGKLIIDKETSSECVSVKKIPQNCETPPAT